MTILDTNKVLVANWFEKEHIRFLLDRNVSDEKYQEIVDMWNDRGIFDAITELVRDWLIDNDV